MSYYDPPQENIHYFRIKQPSDIKNVINNCSKEQWIKMSTTCREWYNKNCSLQGSFDTTMKIINDFSKKNEPGNRFDFNYVFNIKNTFIKNK